MFCPQCGAEYRQGFTRCSDCNLDLVETGAQARPGLKSDPTEWPGTGPQRYFLAWFLPMTLYIVLYFLFFVIQPSSQSPLLSAVLVLMFLGSFATNIGAVWMMYQAIRYEENAKRYFFLAFIPFMFVWYRLVRFPIRPEIIRKPRVNS